MSSQNEKPIIFSTPMVRAILDGRKTETRRVIKPQPVGAVEREMVFDGVGYWHSVNGGPTQYAKCPYGAPGDRLWVRETWGLDEPGILKKCNGKLGLYMDGTALDSHFSVLYKATQAMDPDYPMYWRPSIHMPRWASRITMEVVDVRVERVKSIDHDDARQEGVVLDTVAGGGDDRYPWAFHRLWDSINAKSGRGWDANPWVFVVEFKRLTP